MTTTERAEIVETMRTLCNRIFVESGERDGANFEDVETIMVFYPTAGDATPETYALLEADGWELSACSILSNTLRFTRAE